MLSATPPFPEGEDNGAYGGAKVIIFVATEVNGVEIVWAGNKAVLACWSGATMTFNDGRVILAAICRGALQPCHRLLHGIYR